MRPKPNILKTVVIIAHIADLTRSIREIYDMGMSYGCSFAAKDVKNFGKTFINYQELKNTMPTKKNKPHYIAMSGYHGCLPDHLACFKKYSEAVRDLIDVFQLPRDGVKAAELRKCGYVELDEADWPGRNEHRYGAEYAEIQKCNCDHPKIHDEDFQES